MSPLVQLKTMRIDQLAFSALVSLAAFTSCNNSEDVTTVTTDTTLNQRTETTDVYGTNTINTMPLNREDSAFVMEAAGSGLMEVEAGNLAQQNARNQRVKDFAAMMVRDHQQANQELRTLVASRSMIPDTLSKAHSDQIEKFRRAGNNFDKQYMAMMVQAHNQDVSKFEKAASTLTDQQLRSWAEKTLPILKMHRDSAQAINRARL
jgi:putative membrane protein